MKIHIIAFAFLILSTVSFAAVPEYSGYVNDYAHVIGMASQLENHLREFNQDKRIEFAIVTISELPSGETKESYAYKIFNTWKIGNADSDNGILLLLIANQTSGNRMRLEIGYGLEGDITDSAAGRILDMAVPYYEAGNYTGAAWAVVNGVEYQLSDYNGPTTELKPINYIAPMVLSVIIFILIGIAMAMPRCPKCGSTKLECKKDKCKCKNCGFRFKKKHKAWPYFVAGGMGGGGFSGGGFGGFGGGASGGGGAGR